MLFARLCRGTRIVFLWFCINGTLLCHGRPAKRQVVSITMPFHRNAVEVLSYKHSKGRVMKILSRAQPISEIYSTFTAAVWGKNVLLSCGMQCTGVHSTVSFTWGPWVLRSSLAAVGASACVYVCVCVCVFKVKPTQVKPEGRKSLWIVEATDTWRWVWSAEAEGGLPEMMVRRTSACDIHWMYL